MEMLFDHPFREEIIKPVSPESPLIQLKENRDRNFFEAIFCVELTGVTYLARDFEKTQNRKSEKEAVRNLYHNSLVAGMSNRKELNFIYRGGRDSAGREYFNWEIMGRSTGETSEEALNYINQLWQDVKVFLKVEKKGYHFSPLTSYKDLEKKNIEDAWIVDIQPSGIAISSAGQRKIGYAADADYLNGSKNVVIMPNISDITVKNFDSFAVGVHGCPGSVMLMISIKPMNLKEEEVRSVAIARELLRNASSEQIRYRRDVGVENEDVLTRLKHYSELWLENPAGYRITCTAISDKAIPESFLSMVGSEVFHGCAVTFAVKKGKADNKFLLQNKTSTNTEILDLRDCINSSSALPPLFPRISILSDSGIKRFYTCPSRINLSQTGIILGKTDVSQSVRDVRISRADRSRPTYILGSTGVGKSSLLYNMIRQDIANNESVTVIDPHGDLYNQVLRSIPERRKKDLVLIDPSVVGHSVGINFLECNEQNTPVEMNFIVNKYYTLRSLPQFLIFFSV